MNWPRTQTRNQILRVGLTGVLCLCVYSLPAHAGRAIYSWGSNTNGELGNVSTTSSNVPVAVDMGGALEGKTVVAVSAGNGFSLALDSGGRVYSWGANSSGQMGIGNSNTSTVPLAVDVTGALAGKKIVAIAAGGSHSLALDDAGKVYAWGAAGNGQTGDNSSFNHTSPAAVSTSGVLANVTVVAIAAGLEHSLALGSNGRMYAWGAGSSGQLGNSASIKSGVPVAVDVSGVLNGKTVTAISCGASFNLARTTEGFVYGWGDNPYGQIGNGGDAKCTVPVAVDRSGALAGKNITFIAATGYSSLALDSDGKVYSWGYDGEGQLGNGFAGPSLVPVTVDTSGALNDKTVVRIAGGGNYGVAAADNGRLYSWGYNMQGQLGDGTNTGKTSPAMVDMTGPIAGQTVVVLEAGNFHVLAIVFDGEGIDDVQPPTVTVATPANGQAGN